MNCLFTDLIPVDVAKDALGIDELGKIRRDVAFVMEVKVAGKDCNDLLVILPEGVDKGQGLFRCLRMVSRK